MPVAFLVASLVAQIDQLAVFRPKWILDYILTPQKTGFTRFLHEYQLLPSTLPAADEETTSTHPPSKKKRATKLTAKAQAEQSRQDDESDSWRTKGKQTICTIENHVVNGEQPEQDVFMFCFGGSKSFVSTLQQTMEWPMQ